MCQTVKSKKTQKIQKPSSSTALSERVHNTGANTGVILGNVGYVSVPSKNQLKLNRATASDAGLFLIVEKNWTTLHNDMTTTANSARTRGMHASSAFHMIVPTKSDNIALKRVW